MIEFGKTLREAREAKGLSASQLAEITHILPNIIEDLEKEDFTKIVAPIYGRGFVKLYCETVGIDAQPLIAEFMDIYNGNRQPTIRLKEVEPEDPAPAAEKPTAEAQADVPEPYEPPTFDFSGRKSRSKLPEIPTGARPATDVCTPDSDGLPFRDEPEAGTRRDYRLPRCSVPEMPRSFWRFGILVAVAIAIVAAMVIGMRALYRTTMTAPETSESTKPSVPDPTPSTPRKGVPVPPLYID